jgi:NAD(P)H-hydrate epimerase
MTVGGTGDVLSGLVAGLMAQGMRPFDAAVYGAYANGLAGERAFRRFGLHITATDVVAEIPGVMSRFDKIA